MLSQSDLSLFDKILLDPKITALFFILSLWTLAWKGMALWKSARNDQRNWFVALLIINTFSILELVYIFYFANKKEAKTGENMPKN